MRIERATWQNVMDVALAMRERDFAEFSAVSAFGDRETLARALADRYGALPETLCGFLDDRPVCIGGAIEGRPRVITLLFFATDEFPKIALPVTRWIKRELFDRFKRAGVHRIEAVTLDGYAQTHLWLRTLGLSPETEPLRKYGKNGEDFVQFAWVADD